MTANRSREHEMEDNDAANSKTSGLKFVASWNGSAYQNNSQVTSPPRKDVFYKNLEWSADGTCLIATSNTHEICTILVPANLLDEHDESLEFSDCIKITPGDVIRSTTGYSLFDLQNPGTTLLLSAVRDHPICLYSALSGELAATYPLVNPMTEEYISPHSLAFSPDGRSFVAGSNSRLSFFDVTRPGEEPMSTLSTKNAASPSTSLSGIISTIALEPVKNALVVGTFSRQIGLYDAGGRGECVAVINLNGGRTESSKDGSGVTEVRWSPCGSYLYVAERKSDSVVVYDTRKTCEKVSWLEGRKAMTNQRLGFDVASGDDGAQEVWAGGVDGAVRMWSNPHHQQGAVAPDLEQRVGEGRLGSGMHQTWELTAADAVNAVVMHRAGGVLATSCGQRHFDPADNNIEHPSKVQTLTSGIKIWTVD